MKMLIGSGGWVLSSFIKHRSLHLKKLSHCIMLVLLLRFFFYAWDTKRAEWRVARIDENWQRPNLRHKASHNAQLRRVERTLFFSFFFFFFHHHVLLLERRRRMRQVVVVVAWLPALNGPRGLWGGEEKFPHFWGGESENFCRDATTLLLRVCLNEYYAGKLRVVA